MGEYITRNNVISAVCFGCNQEFSDEPCEPSQCAIRQSIMALPTADVVPKSEVDEIIRQWKEEANCWQNIYIAELRDNEQIKAEVAKAIFDEIESIIRKHDERPKYQLMLDLAVLKKKYVEGEG